jgi:hypothetical protein
VVRVVAAAAAAAAARRRRADELAAGGGGVTAATFASSVLACPSSDSTRPRSFFRSSCRDLFLVCSVAVQPATPTVARATTTVITGQIDSFPVLLLVIFTLV